MEKVAEWEELLKDYDDGRVRNILPQILASFLIAASHLQIGLCFGFSGILLPALEDPKSDLKTSVSERSWIASSTLLAMALTGPLIGRVVDNFGRLNVLRMSNIPSVVGWVLIAMASDTTMLLVGRTLTGCSAVSICTASGVYISEISKPDVRGSLINMMAVLSSFGIALSYFEGYLMHWRLVAWTCIPYALANLFIQLFVHESPEWLISKGKTKEAKRSLEWFYKYQVKQDSQGAAHFHYLILQKRHELHLEKKLQERGTRIVLVREILKPTAYKPLFVIFGLFALQQFSGTYVVLLNAVKFLKSVGIEADPYLTANLLSGMNLTVAVINTFIRKIFANNTLLYISCILGAICLFISGVFTKWILEGTSEDKWVPVIFLTIFLVLANIGLQTIPWSMIGELFPLAVRGIFASVSATLATGLMFAAIQSYYTLDSVLGSHGTQYTYGVVCLLGTVFIKLFVPETHGKTLSEIETFFKNNGCK